MYKNVPYWHIRFYDYLSVLHFRVKAVLRVIHMLKLRELLWHAWRDFTCAHLRTTYSWNTHKEYSRNYMLAYERGKSNMHNDTCTRLRQPRERKPISTGRERQGTTDRTKYPTELWFIDLFSSIFLPFLLQRKYLCARLISIVACFKRGKSKLTKGENDVLNAAHSLWPEKVKLSRASCKTLTWRPHTGCLNRWKMSVSWWMEWMNECKP